MNNRNVFVAISIVLLFAGAPQQVVSSFGDTSYCDIIVSQTPSVMALPVNRPQHCTLGIDQPNASLEVFCNVTEPLQVSLFSLSWNVIHLVVRDCQLTILEIRNFSTVHVRNITIYPSPTSFHDLSDSSDDEDKYYVSIARINTYVNVSFLSIVGRNENGIGGITVEDLNCSVYVGNIRVSNLQGPALQVYSREGDVTVEFVSVDAISHARPSDTSRSIASAGITVKRRDLYRLNGFTTIDSYNFFPPPPKPNARFAVVRNIIVHDTYAERGPGALFLSSFHYIELSNITIWNVTANVDSVKAGGAIAIMNVTIVSLRWVGIENAISTISGGCVAVYATSVTYMYDSTLRGCDSGIFGGAFFVSLAQTVFYQVELYNMYMEGKARLFGGCFGVFGSAAPFHYRIRNVTFSRCYAGYQKNITSAYVQYRSISLPLMEQLFDANLTNISSRTPTLTTTKSTLQRVLEQPNQHSSLSDSMKHTSRLMSASVATVTTVAAVGGGIAASNTGVRTIIIILGTDGCVDETLQGLTKETSWVLSPIHYLIYKANATTDFQAAFRMSSYDGLAVLWNGIFVIVLFAFCACAVVCVRKGGSSNTMLWSRACDACYFPAVPIFVSSFLMQGTLFYLLRALSSPQSRSTLTMGTSIGLTCAAVGVTFLPVIVYPCWWLRQKHKQQTFQYKLYSTMAKSAKGSRHFLVNWLERFTVASFALPTGFWVPDLNSHNLLYADTTPSAWYEFIVESSLSMYMGLVTGVYRETSAECSVEAALVVAGLLCYALYYAMLRPLRSCAIVVLRVSATVLNAVLALYVYVGYSAGSGDVNADSSQTWINVIIAIVSVASILEAVITILSSLYDSHVLRDVEDDGGVDVLEEELCEGPRFMEATKSHDNTNTPVVVL
eukprot:PhF_6_TR32981/c0_g2_i1/m.48576